MVFPITNVKQTNAFSLFPLALTGENIVFPSVWCKVSVPTMSLCRIEQEIPSLYHKNQDVKHNNRQ